jgi:adenylate cyclase
MKKIISENKMFRASAISFITLILAFLLLSCIEFMFQDKELSTVHGLALLEFVIIFVAIFSITFSVMDAYFYHISQNSRKNKSFFIMRTLAQTLVMIGIIGYFVLHQDFIRLVGQMNVSHLGRSYKLLEPLFAGMFVIFLFINLLLNLVLIAMRFLGLENIANILFDRYQPPREVEKFIMYLDLNDSTALAERLGNDLFINFIQDFFLDVGLAVKQTLGNVYEYVGDEVVINWDLDNGVDKDNCVRFFYLVENLIQQNAAHYQLHYQALPRFKASLHVGKLMVASLGYNKVIVKMRGNVLNTGARIIAECHNVKRNFLISMEVRQKFNTTSAYQFENMGLFTLKGLAQEIPIYSVSQKIEGGDNVENKQQ